MPYYQPHSGIRPPLHSRLLRGSVKDQPKDMGRWIMTGSNMPAVGPEARVTPTIIVIIMHQPAERHTASPYSRIFEV